MRPTSSDMREPKMIAESTSRPWSSVPRRYVGLPLALHAGGVIASSRFSVARSNGLWGVTQGARRAASTKTAVMSAASITPGRRRKL